MLRKEAAPEQLRIIKMISILATFLILLSLPAQPASARGRKTVTGINASGVINRELAVDPILKKDGFSTVLYDNTNGLPTSEANAVAETGDGFLWIGSYSGLIRYDGNIFERIDPTIALASVVDLFVDSRDRLWIGTNDNGVFLIDKDNLWIWGKEDGLKSFSIRDFAEDKDGTIYVATTEGLATIDMERKLSLFGDDRLDNAFVQTLKTGSDGVIYGLTTEGDIFSVRDRKLLKYLSHDEIDYSTVTEILPDPEKPGHMYIGTEDNRILYGEYDSDFNVVGIKDISPLESVNCLEYIDGQIWVCAENGIGVIRNDGFRQLKNMPMTTAVKHVMTDYEGNMWFTSTRQGLMKITPNRFSDVFERFALPEAVVNSTCQYEDKLFIGTDSGLTVIDTRGVVTSLPLTKAVTASGEAYEADDLISLLDGCRIRSIIRDSRNSLWISTWRKLGLLRYAQGELTVFDVSDGLFSDRIRTVYERRDGSMLVANTGGVSIIEGDKVIASYGQEDGIVNPETLSVAEGFDGEILAGSDGGGISVIDGDRIRSIRKADGLTSEIIMRIKPDPARRIYWIVTSNSLSYMTDKFEVVTIDRFPYSNNYDVFEDKNGIIWVLSSNGVYIVPAENLLANEKIETLYFGLDNGMHCMPTANAYSELTDEGNLYIAGSSGVTKVNIDEYESYEKIDQIKVSVPFLDADGETIFPDSNGNFEIASGVRKLTIFSYVFNYSLVMPTVSYQLEGFDRKSTTLSRSNLDPIVYTNLPGGTYQFTMDLMNSMGRVGKTIAIKIIKDKAFYEEIWFYVITVVLLTCLFVLLVRRYIRRRLDIQEKKHRETAEKERIARELDTAARIQSSMLPGGFPVFRDRNEFDIYASMNPAREVGGDFYDFFLIDEDHLGLVMADVSGKGIPAALFMMFAKSLIQNSAMLGESPARVLKKTNETLCSNNQMEMFVTVWIGILQISTGRITAANAGHEYPFVYHAADGTFSVLHDKHGFVIGGMEGVKYQEYEICLARGDKLFLYTDGVTEATDSRQELFGMERLTQVLNQTEGLHPEEILRKVRIAVDQFVGNEEQFDDLTMMCLEYMGK